MLNYPSKIVFPDNGFSLGENILLRENSIPINEDLMRKFPDLYFQIPTNDELLFSFSKLKNEEIVAERIRNAIKNEEKIRIIGDYDCDGVMATLVFMITLKHLNANVSFIIPDRIEDGYGMNNEMIDNAKKDDISLIITCDNGISCKEQVDYAKSLGIDVIITDHHKPTEGMVPENVLIINPKFNNDIESEISGAFVALKTIRQLISDENYTSEMKKIIRELMFFAGISTISDVMPLFSENRLLVMNTLKTIYETKENRARDGRIFKFLSSLGGKYYLLSKEKLPSIRLLSFSIAPVINAVGRIGENVSELVQFILDCESSDNFNEKFIEFNDIRRERTEEIFKNYKESDGRIEFFVLKESDYAYPLDGLFGVVSNRILGDTGKPTFVGKGKDGILSFSARSPSSFKLHSAIEKIKTENPDLGISGGGHEQALGFRIPEKNIEKFKNLLEDNFEENCVEREENLYALEPETIDDIVSAHQRFALFGQMFESIELCYKGNFMGSQKYGKEILVGDYVFRLSYNNDADVFEEGSELEVIFKIALDEKKGPYFLVQSVKEI